MIRCLHLIDDYLPPSQIWMYHLIEACKDVEHNVLALNYLPKPFYLNGVNYLRHPKGHYYKWKQTIGKGTLALFLRLFLKLKERFATQELELLINLLKQEDIQILHAHFAHTAIRYLPLAKALGLPLVVSFYGHDYEKIPFTKPYYKTAYQKLFKQAHTLICEGPHGKEILINMGCNAEKIKIIPLGIKSIYEDVRPLFYTKPLTDRPIKLLQIADFTPKKGQDLSIRAVDALIQRGIKVELSLVGRARDENFALKCESLIKELSLTGVVKIVPFVPYNKLKFQFAQHDIFIHPSRYTEDRDCEGGAPVILLDAQAAGLPIVSTKHCDIPFLVKHGITGFLTEEESIEGLADSVMQIQQKSSEELESLIVDAKSNVLNDFLVTKSGETLTALYTNVTTTSPAPKKDEG